MFQGELGLPGPAGVDGEKVHVRKCFLGWFIVNNLYICNFFHQGSRGDMGEAGPQGERGEKGEMGLSGPAVSCEQIR